MPAASKTSHHFTLHLIDPRDLFVAPDYDPFNPHALNMSGIDSIASHLKSYAVRSPVSVRLVLPRPAITPDLEPRLRAALARYCEEKIGDHHREILSLRWQGVKALQIAAVFLSICLFLSEWLGHADFLAAGVQRVLGEGFLIAGWVSVWRPTELFLFDWWESWRSSQIHRAIMNMAIEIVAELDTAHPGTRPVHTASGSRPAA